MPLVISILNIVRAIAGICAILAMGFHCAYEMLAVIERRFDDVGHMDNAAWLGLAYFGLWMACSVGRIGL